MLMLSHASAM